MVNDTIGILLTSLNPALRASNCLLIPDPVVTSITKAIYFSRFLIYTCQFRGNILSWETTPLNNRHNEFFIKNYLQSTRYTFSGNGKSGRVKSRPGSSFAFSFSLNWISATSLLPHLNPGYNFTSTRAWYLSKFFPNSGSKEIMSCKFRSCINEEIKTLSRAKYIDLTCMEWNSSNIFWNKN